MFSLVLVSIEEKSKELKFAKRTQLVKIKRENPQATVQLSVLSCWQADQADRFQKHVVLLFTRKKRLNHRM